MQTFKYKTFKKHKEVGFSTNIFTNYCNEEGC